MVFDGTELVRSTQFLSDLDYRVEGVLVKHYVHRYWGVSYGQDFTMLGSPYQLSGGPDADVPVLLTREHTEASQRLFQGQLDGSDIRTGPLNTI